MTTYPRELEFGQDPGSAEGIRWTGAEGKCGNQHHHVRAAHYPDLPDANRCGSGVAQPTERSLIGNQGGTVTSDFAVQ